MVFWVLSLAVFLHSEPPKLPLDLESYVVVIHEGTMIHEGTVIDEGTGLQDDTPRMPACTVFLTRFKQQWVLWFGHHQGAYMRALFDEEGKQLKSLEFREPEGEGEELVLVLEVVSCQQNRISGKVTTAGPDFFFESGRTFTLQSVLSYQAEALAAMFPKEFGAGESDDDALDRDEFDVQQFGRIISHDPQSEPAQKALRGLNAGQIDRMLEDVTDPHAWGCLWLIAERAQTRILEEFRDAPEDSMDLSQLAQLLEAVPGPKAEIGRALCERLPLSWGSLECLRALRVHGDVSAVPKLVELRDSFPENSHERVACCVAIGSLCELRPQYAPYMIEALNYGGYKAYVCDNFRNSSSTFLQVHDRLHGRLKQIDPAFDLQKSVSPAIWEWLQRLRGKPEPTPGAGVDGDKK